MAALHCRLPCKAARHICSVEREGIEGEEEELEGEGEGEEEEEIE